MSKKTVEWLNSNTSNVMDFFDFNIDSNKSYIKNVLNTNKKIVIEECDGQDVVLNKVLSGGERNRLQLALALKQEGNVLLLDEPTNDIDVNTLRALEEGLRSAHGVTSNH